MACGPRLARADAAPGVRGAFMRQHERTPQ
jgi:hypothetical protein